MHLPFRIGGFGWTLFMVLVCPKSAWCESIVSAGVLVAADDQHYHWQQYQLSWRVEDPSFGLHASGRLHAYALDEELAGVLPFRGTEPAAKVGGHVLLDLWWCAASVGFQGDFALSDATAQLVVARAIPVDSSTFTPRIELTRGPLAPIPLPLSLGLSSERAEALLAWRAPGWTAEGGLRVDFWEPDEVQDRVRNAALAVIDANRVTTLHAYLLTQREHWFDWGLAAKAAWSSRNTMLPTQLQPTFVYSWYPVSASPFNWETALVVRAHGDIARPVGVSLQVQLPMVSQETRQWESLKRSYWWTAPVEAKLQSDVHFLPTTTLQLIVMVFLKPWQNWNVFGSGAYLQGSAQLSIEQHI